MNSGTLTDVSRQWRVRPWQGGRGAGEDEAFPVTGPATGTRRQQRSDQYLSAFKWQLRSHKTKDSWCTHH